MNPQRMVYHNKHNEHMMINITSIINKIKTMVIENSSIKFAVINKEIMNFS